MGLVDAMLGNALGTQLYGMGDAQFGAVQQSGLGNSAPFYTQGQAAQGILNQSSCGGLLAGLANAAAAQYVEPERRVRFSNSKYCDGGKGGGSKRFGTIKP